MNVKTIGLFFEIEQITNIINAFVKPDKQKRDFNNFWA